MRVWSIKTGLLSQMHSEMSRGADLRNIFGNRRESMKNITQKLLMSPMNDIDAFLRNLPVKDAEPETKSQCDWRQRLAA